MNKINKKEIEDFIQESEKLYSTVKRGIKHKNVDNNEFCDLLSQGKYAEIFLNKLASEKEFKENNQLIYNAYDKRDTTKLINRLNESKKQNNIRHIKLIALSVATSVVAILFYVYGLDKPLVNNEFAINIIAEQKIKVPTIIAQNSIEIELKNESSVLSVNEIEKIIEHKRINSDTITAKQAEQRRIIIPKGYTYSIVLSDGTTVTLNAGSELLFPTSFEGKNRKVTLSGEAYFDVTKSEKPFIVDINNTYVKVYGYKI